MPHTVTLSRPMPGSAGRVVEVNLTVPDTTVPFDEQREAALATIAGIFLRCLARTLEVEEESPGILLLALLVEEMKEFEGRMLYQTWHEAVEAAWRRDTLPLFTALEKLHGE